MSKIRKVKLKNIRSITEETEIELDSTGLTRIGGRNGRGKSTLFTIGLKILLGLTPAKPHLNSNSAEGYYTLVNEYGEFTVTIHRRGNPTYSYYLNTGEHNSSRDTINHNRCIDVIRSYIGFDLDTENNGVLNINEKDKLNFITTNGRSDLAYLKGLVYSEEIETLQEETQERIKTLKETKNKTSYEISLVHTSLQKLNTVDENYLDEIDEYSDYVINVEKYSEELTNQLLDFQQNYKSFLSICKINLISNLGTISSNIVGLKAIDELIKMLNRHEYHRKIVLSVMRLYNDLNEYQLNKSKIKLNESKILLSKLNRIQVNQANHTLSRVDILKDSLSKLDILSYFRNDQLVKFNLYKNLNNNILEYSSTLKKLAYKKLYINYQLNEYSKDQLNNFLQNLSLLKKQKSVQHISDIFVIIETLECLFYINQDIIKLECEIDNDIYKDGRCILCYSTR